jgi:hypothetical protein
MELNPESQVRSEPRISGSLYDHAQFLVPPDPLGRRLSAKLELGLSLLQAQPAIQDTLR